MPLKTKHQPAPSTTYIVQLLSCWKYNPNIQ